MNALINRPATLIRRTESGETDDYGNDIPNEDPVEIVAEVQQQDRSEPSQHPDVSNSNWLAFFQPGTVVHAADSLIVDGVEYEVLGEPWPVRDPLSTLGDHIEATVRRVAGDEEGAS